MIRLLFILGLLALAGCAPARMDSSAKSGGRPINEIPMYGGRHDPGVRQDKAVSRDMAQNGWIAFYRNDFDTAIKRFNQAWMFDRDNVDAYWGFGVVLGQRAAKNEEPEPNLKNSIHFLQMAHEKAPGNARLLADLAFSHTTLGSLLKTGHPRDTEAEKHFVKASRMFAEAYNLEPTYPPLVANYSIHYFYTGEYGKAKSKAEEAKQLGFKFDPAYVKDLENHLR